ncbi:MAG: bifunctional [glutamate--ammonia ligase]-adenylyl-L-tyrosine phosphorylase/[glutamate--ammonia-ligase] adenylyltransferase [Candidatus Thiodiazotropha sp. (ex Lucina aurantia)]|nr:bifunctional [glutamate--ammonia ligase]-adenylyl-L-tyrosine phosphorylase/[glutamate--ammonia-ligase] adenylyltransferase [Candidatus Thiodiazotropha sp. (ex Lucina pensylvanica)]MBT3023863.1 bifunctional [glutamate--ammonia ligase]-adenylyl-L-tyrosine phosphorylase/[glutamate--ammonia-ligase] adenylyltransferase [Candidatus Thiodiazotropha taylori]MBV2100133.1 bifunctional [glutamate--ammonia ligase]-adenylyl-L-tyrosine phosphorylase/[glutamate--ammonia-ligase] adenylyltransferase [Candidatu
MGLRVNLQQETEKQWQQWRQKLNEAGLSIPQQAEFHQAALKVWEASDYVVQCALRYLELLPDLYRDGDLNRSFNEGEMSQRLALGLESVSDETGLSHILREFRRRQMVRIIWRDLAGLAPLDETLEDLSALADSCIDRALQKLYAWFCDQMGTPRNQEGEAQSLVVLGMGKLGARELNLSSDIDLIFAYPEGGQTDGVRQFTNEQFFIRLCQRLVQVLDNHTGDGFVFRVDTRLRPFGSAGPLAMSFAAMESYYGSQGREWERYAMIKARVVAGDSRAGDELMALLRPFVYRRYLDFGAIESLREMKQLISNELHKKGMEANIKLGPGGIREIEFIGQAFQLIRGGRDKELQIRPILLVLQCLQERGLMPEYAVQELSESYRYLRLVENRLQAWQDRQTHLLPADEVGRLRLARSMGYACWDDFSSQLEHYRRRVQEHFDMVFAAPQTSSDEETQPLTGVWHDSVDQEQAIEALRAAGFSNSEQALRQLHTFRGSHAYRRLSTKGRERLDQLMPLLLEAVGQSEWADDTLHRVTGLLEAIAQRTAYIALLVENPLVLSQLVKLTAVSPWVANMLIRHPILLDELLDPRRLYSPLKRAELNVELADQLARIDENDLESQMELLRLFAQSNRLRVAAADIAGQIPLMVVSDYLTWIAESVIEQVIRLTYLELVRRHGRPPGLARDETGFAVVGYGKLGGIELGFGSDLDMVFLHGCADRNAFTDGHKPVSVDVFYARMAQRFIHIMTTRTPSGILYDVDMRLRPNGNSGMMVSSLETFETYQHNNAWTWEHQALVRARVVAGDKRINDRFEAIRHQVLSRQQDPARLQSEVVEMREKMRAGLDKSNPDQFDLKQGTGGIVDIEFMVQYTVLRWAHDYPELLVWTDNIRLLETMSKLGLLNDYAAERMMGIYKVLRAAYHRSALQDLPALVEIEKLAEERALVQEIWSCMMQNKKTEREMFQ